MKVKREPDGVSSVEADGLLVWKEVTETLVTMIYVIYYFPVLYYYCVKIFASGVIREN